MKERLGLLGGTFNPIHLGHLNTAVNTQDELNLDSVFFIPAAMPPHKNFKNIISLEHRLNMLKLALENYSNFVLSTIEVELPGKSYTIDTLEVLSELHPQAELFFIIGADNLKEIKYWKNPEGILEKTNLVVMNRPGFTGDYKSYEKYFTFLTNKNLIKKIKLVTVKDMDISSTEIRNRVFNKRPINNMVPERVEKYIFENGLYDKDLYL